MVTIRGTLLRAVHHSTGDICAVSREYMQSKFGAEHPIIPISFLHALVCSSAV
jgi:hypothetical protein